MTDPMPARPLQLPPAIRADRDDIIHERQILTDWPVLRKRPADALPRPGDTIRVRTAANQFGTARILHVDHDLGQVLLVPVHWDGLQPVAADELRPEEAGDLC